MTAPHLAAIRFAMALGVGAVLGVIYGFLRPLRPRLTGLCDGIFVLCAFYGWVYLGFGLCQGDLRFGYTAGMAMGGLLWELSVGRLLRHVFRGFWHFLAILALPLKKIYSFFKLFCKKVFAKCKNWVTMEWYIGRCAQRPKTTGGAVHGKAQTSRSFQKIQPPGKGCDSDHRSAFHHRTDHAVRHH